MQPYRTAAQPYPPLPQSPPPATYPPPAPTQPHPDPAGYRQPYQPDYGALVPCEEAQKIAQVGELSVLYSEVKGRVDEVMEKNKDRIPASQIEMQRKLLTQQLLKNLIETKLIYNDARRSIPEENFPQVEKSLAEQFDNAELKNMMKRAKVATRQELEAKLRTMGTSLQREKRAFAERTLSRQWVRQKIKPNEEITVDQMWAYYNEHIADFQKPGRVRWQQLTARFSKHPSKQVAYAAIGQMGNRVLARVPMDQVAKAESDGTTASDGGLRDWTFRNSLVSEVLDRAIFELPVGQLSPILEDATGYHIIRVTEREEDSQTSFPDAQPEIRPKITQRRNQEQLQAYLAKLRKNTRVWTIFDKPDDQRISTRPDQQKW